MTWVLDLDGVVWLADQPIPGAAAAVARLREAGVAVVFVTNNSSPTVEHYVAKLAAMGIAASADELVTSAQAAASMVSPGETALCCAGPGVHEALAGRGVAVTDEGPADAVVVGLTPEFDYRLLARALAAVLGGARLIGTNGDPTYPTPGGLLPGAGSLVAAVAYASSRSAEMAGKPHGPLVALLRERARGPVEMVVGDRPSTDGALARRLGAHFGLVLSGVTPVAAGADPQPDAVGADLAELVVRAQ